MCRMSGKVCIDAHRYCAMARYEVVKELRQYVTNQRFCVLFYLSRAPRGPSVAGLSARNISQQVANGGS